MAYEPYVTPEYYQNEYCGSIVPGEQLRAGPAGILIR